MPLPHPIPPLLPAGTQWSCHKAINTSKCLFILAFGSPGPLQAQHGMGQPGLVVSFPGQVWYLRGGDGFHPFVSFPVFGREAGGKSLLVTLQFSPVQVPRVVFTVPEQE